MEHHKSGFSKSNKVGLLPFCPSPKIKSLIGRFKRIHLKKANSAKNNIADIFKKAQKRVMKKVYPNDKFNRVNVK